MRKVLIVLALFLSLGCVEKKYYDRPPYDDHKGHSGGWDRGDDWRRRHDHGWDNGWHGNGDGWDHR